MSRVVLVGFLVLAVLGRAGLGEGTTAPASDGPVAVTAEVVLKPGGAGGGSFSNFRWVDEKRIVFSATLGDLRLMGPSRVDAEAMGATEGAWVVVMDLETKACLLVHRGANPVPSPDGKRVMFVSGKTERPEVWVSSLDGTDARAITAGEVFNPYPHWSDADVYFKRAWSRDSKQVAYVMRPAVAKKVSSATKSQSESTVVVIGGTGDVGPDTEVWVVDVASGESRRLTSGPYNIWDEPSWSADDSTVLVDCVTQVDARTDDTRGEVRAVNVKTGEVRTVVKDHGVQLLRSSYSPDGKTIGFTADPSNVYYPDLYNIAMAPAEGGAVRELTRNLFVDSSPLWDPKGTGVYFRAKKGVSSQIWFAGTDGAVRQVTSGMRSSFSPAVSPEGRRLLWRSTDLLSHQQLRVGNVDGSDEKAVAELSMPARNLKLGAVEAVEWKSTDGLVVAGLLVRPVGFEAGKKYPMIVDLHGGPVGGASLSGSILLSRLEPHLWANKGYVVFLPDYRSSGVYGREYIEKAREKQDANERDMDDIMSGVEWVVSQGFVDTERMALVGHSYGAFLVNWIITHSQRFKVAVSYEGYLDTYLMYGTGFRVGGNPAFEYLYKGVPWEVPENYRRNSPLEFVKGVKTPTLLVSGEKGMALYNNEFLYTALKKQKVDAKFLVYKGEGHVISAPANRRDLLEQVVEWIEGHLGR